MPPPQSHNPTRCARASMASYEYPTGEAIEESCHEGTGPYHSLPEARRHGLQRKSTYLFLLENLLRGHPRLVQGVSFFEPASLATRRVDP